MAVYPNSFDVIDGMPTAYQHYNYLRADALRLGQPEADAVNLGVMLARYESNLNLEIIEPKRLRVVASAAAPVGIVIGGYPLQAVANVDLSAGLSPVGVAAEYYVFVVRTSALTGFSLDVNTTPTETSTRRIIGQFYFDGTKIVKDSIRTSWQEAGKGALLGVAAQVADGRLTLVSGSAVADAGASVTVFYTPAVGNRIALYVNNVGWKVYSFSEASLPLAGLASGNYDIFASNPSGEGYGLTLEAVKWSNDTTRATAVVMQNGVWVKNADPAKRYLGSVRLYAVGTTIDSLDQRFVWNAYNRQPRMLSKQADAVSWTYAGAGVWRMANASAVNRVECVVGLPDAWADVGLSCSVQVLNSGNATVGLGLDDAASEPIVSSPRVIEGHKYSAGTVQERGQVMGRTWGQMAIGYHYFQWMEIANTNTATFYGQTTNGAHGINGIVEG